MAFRDQVKALSRFSDKSRQGWSYLEFILVLAALVRLCTVWFAVSHPTWDWPVGAGNEEAVLARSILAGHGLSSPFGGSTGPTAFVAPGYPFLVAGVFHIFGPATSASILVVLLMQAAFSIATIAILMSIARQFFGRRTAVIAGSVWAFSAPMMWMPTIFWDTCLSALVLTGMVYLALRSCERQRIVVWVAMGAVSGLGGLVNPSLIPTLLALMAWGAFQQRDRWKTVWLPAFALLTMLVIFAPWPIRNFKTLHAFIPLRSNFGFELWNGNYPGGNGKFIEHLHPYYSKGELNRYMALGEVGYMEEKTSLAKATIRKYPLRFVANSSRRLLDFWLGLAQKGDQTSGLIVLHAVLTTLTGTVGLVLLFKRDRAIAWIFLLPMVIFPLPYYVTHPDLRFRLLIDPLLTILGSYAVARLLTHLAVEPAAELTSGLCRTGEETA